MKRVFILRIVLIATILLTASVASAVSNWTRPDASGAGDWGTAANWDTEPAAATDYTYLGTAASNADIEVTSAETYGYRMALGHTSSVPPVLTIKSGGSLSQGTYSTGSHSYVGRNAGGDGYMIIEAGGTFSTNAKLFIGTYSGSQGTVDVYGTLDLTQGYGNLCLGENATTGQGFLNILDGGVVKVSTFQDTYKGMQYKSFGAGSMIDIQGSGIIKCTGNKLTYAQEAITYGQISGNGIVGNVVSSYDAGLDETSITAVPLADIPLEVTVEADKGYTRGLAPLTVGATVVDDGNPAPAVLTWSQTAGPGIAAFESPNAATTFVDFDSGGVYTLRLTADNTAGGGSEIVYDELEVTASNPTCQDLKDHNMRLVGDVNGNCYVNLADVAEIATAWLNCNNPQDTGCNWAWE